MIHSWDRLHIMAIYWASVKAVETIKILPVVVGKTNFKEHFEIVLVDFRNKL